MQLFTYKDKNKNKKIMFFLILGWLGFKKKKIREFIAVVLKFLVFTTSL